MNDGVTPPSGNAPLQAALTAMQLRYVETSRGAVRAFSLLGEQLAGAPDSLDLLTALRRELHRVHGTAGSLGFHEAGRMAGAMEELSTRWTDDPSLDRDGRSVIVLNFARALGAAIADPADMMLDAPRRIVLVSLADSVAERLVAVATQRGFAVERMNEESYRKTQPGAVPALVVAREAAADTVATATPSVPTLLLSKGRSTVANVSAPGVQMIPEGTDPNEMIDWIEFLLEPGSAGRDTVFVLDDDPVLLMLLRVLVERDGLIAHTAADSDAFRALFALGKPSLAVMDVEMPGVDGISLLRELRNDVDWRDVPVLMLSGRIDSDTRTKAFEAGANDYMVKPLVASEFQHRVRQLLESQRQRRVSMGLRPGTDLSKPARTTLKLEAWVQNRGEQDWSVGVVRATAAPPAGAAITAWEHECTRVARLIRDAGGVAGFTDGNALAFAIPRTPSDTVTVLNAFAAGAPSLAPAWHAGVNGGAASDAPPLRSLLATAGDAEIAAREAGVPAMAWDPSSSALAPDVIVVEDDPTLRDLLAFALTATGMSYRAYANGPDGLNALLHFRPREHPSIVLLDVDLPGLDGHSLHERLRIERPGAYQVVFVSIHGSETDQLRAIQGGALDYMTKPISLRVLMAKLAVWRGRTRAK